MTAPFSPSVRLYLVFTLMELIAKIGRSTNWIKRHQVLQNNRYLLVTLASIAFQMLLAVRPYDSLLEIIT